MLSSNDVVSSYEIAPGVFVLGCLAQGVTVYGQQVRALNLAAALSALGKSNARSVKRVAVIGAGMAGLTFAAAVILSSPATASVTLFERRWDLCPLQQGCDTRWLHPNIYDWPSPASHNPDAGLPVLSWYAGRASDIAADMLASFARYAALAERASRPKLKVVLGATHVVADLATRRLEWMGYRTQRSGNHFLLEQQEGDTQQFDCIVIAAGFGLERETSGGVGSYWRNDSLGQPQLGGGQQVYVVSGYGDGGIIDLCRLTIERFRQDLILEELFADDLQAVEAALWSLTGQRGGRISENLKLLLEGAPALSRMIQTAADRLNSRLRKDTRAILHLRAEASQPHSIDRIFGERSSLLNRTILYLLYKAGAFDLRIGDIETNAADGGIKNEILVRRHGTDSLAELLGLFTDQSAASAIFSKLKSKTDPSSEILWPAGYFPPNTLEAPK